MAITSKEAAKFLHEIEDSDSEYDLQMKEEIRKIQIEEMQDDLLPEEMMSDRAWGFTVKAERDDNGEMVRNESGRVVITKRPVLYEEKKKEWENFLIKKKMFEEKNRVASDKKRLQIKRDALENNLKDLNKSLTVEDKKIIISLMSAKYQSLMDKSLKYINNRIETLLKPYIPHVVKSCWAQYPDIFKINDGFMYEASKEYGKSLALWVTPNIPFFFSKGTEMDMLRETSSEFLFHIDKAVVTYYEQRDKLVDMQSKYAFRLTKIDTFLKLVEKHPFWYDKYIKWQEQQRIIKEVEDKKLSC
jgi:hypothetical protein